MGIDRFWQAAKSRNFERNVRKHSSGLNKLQKKHHLERNAQEALPQGLKPFALGRQIVRDKSLTYLSNGFLRML
jgi:hypothetical protein